MVLHRLLLSIFMLFMPCLVLAANHLILISVDGLRPDIIGQLGEQALPGFYRFHNQGVSTDNARTDFDYTRTLPNHSSMITGRSVIGTNGHGQTENNRIGPADTLHNNTGQYGYIPGLFDVAHDNGLSTALYASKDKFVLFDQSYNAENGAEDITGADNGSAKIDRYLFLASNRTATNLIDRFVEDMKVNSYNLAFVHITDPDYAGHGGNWTTQAYRDAVKRVDGYLQNIFALVNESTELAGNTVIILIADHGGTGADHSDASDLLNYRIPFYVWGSGVAKGQDLYLLNRDSRHDPEDARPDYNAPWQPVRNGDAGNLALQLLGLPAISGSTINARQDLKVAGD